VAAHSSLLRALTILHTLHPAVNVHHILAFLHAAEGEGRTIGDIAQAAGFTQSTASRSLRGNGKSGCGWALHPALGLLEANLADWDARSHLIFLSSQGRALCDRLDGIAREACTLRAPAAPISGVGRAD
jgi:DNA-binding MarR family transcriptional regulator